MTNTFRLRLAGTTFLALMPLLLTAAPVQNPANGHYYEFVPNGHLPDDDRNIFAALDGSAARTHLGLPGYLVTITSSEEQSFLSTQFGTDGWLWIAASDRAQEGVWRWLSGPEEGQELQYTWWAGGEPNNLGWEPSGEDYAIMNWGGGWNDMPTNRNDLISGYVVEYSAVPEPGTWAMTLAGATLLAGVRCKRARPQSSLS